MTESLALPDKTNLVQNGKDLIVAARDHECTNDPGLQKCLNFFAFIKARKKEVQADIDRDLTPKINLLHKMHKDACELRTRIILPYDQAESIIESIMSGFMLG